MENKGLLSFLIILLVLWILAGTWYIGSNFCGSGETAPPAEIIEEDLPLGMEVYDGNTLIGSASSFIDFERSSFTKDSLSASMTELLSNTVNYLNDNPERQLAIMGFYTEDEEQPSLFPDLGIARANYIKENLEELGAPSARLTAYSELADTLGFVNDTLRNGISFSFSEATGLSEDSRIERIREEIINEPLSVYFESGDVSLNLTQEQKEDLADMIYYLDRIAESYLEIGGHTDSMGDPADNKRFSRQRARTVRDYITQSGIASDRIKIVGYGQDKPVASNKYKDGRQQNRRAEIILLDGK